MSAENDVVENEREDKAINCWVAIKDDKVINAISMRVDERIDFEEYRKRARSLLEMVGDVKTGEAVKREGEYVFVQRLTHQNRGKSPRVAKEYPFKPPFL